MEFDTPRKSWFIPTEKSSKSFAFNYDEFTIDENSWVDENYQS